MQNFEDLKEKYIRLKVNLENLDTKYKKLSSKLASSKKDLIIFEDAKEIISSSMHEVQLGFKSTVEETVNEVISFIWDDREYRFELSPKEKAGCYEWEPKIFDGEEELDDLKTDVGGGLISTIGFVFKIVFHILSEKNLRNTLIFDEPVSNLGLLTAKFGEIVSFLSDKFGVQFIIVTHDKNLCSLTGNKYIVVHNGKYSEVTRV